VENEIINQKLLIEEIKAGPAKLPILQEAVDKISALLEKDTGIDSDEDGLYDSVEIEISEYSATIADVVGLSVLNLNPEEEESTPSRKDASVARGYLSQLNSQLINTGILVEGQEKFLNEGLAGLKFLETALEQRLWEVSFEDIAESTFGGNIDDAKRAVGLFNAYCARCHTAGYSAGVAYTKKMDLAD